MELVHVFTVLHQFNGFKTGYATDETGIPDGWLGLDSGEKTNVIFRETILEAKTILWNGQINDPVCDSLQFFSGTGGN
ncbi:hypothetical protein Glove_88g8 [Diversispora epigaea]|uniref:phosphoglycerate kinase n=1 Tax=Diversispora epigaea TaxID=1348612 RepID=A0A397J9G8_9GLOM|nr:hypothetical protein Glove_88g8 [Diversispora epigaea]